MLVLSRKKDERINIGPDVEVVILGINGNRVRLGLIAPPQVPILREELQARAEWAAADEPLEAEAWATEGAGGAK